MRELTVAIRTYPHTAALKDGTVKSQLVSLRFVEFNDITDSFDSMVMDQAFDVGELAVVTFLQAHAAGKPIVLLPAVMTGGVRHDRLQYLAENGPLAPEQLRGARLGVRAYSQTTGLWVRGILQEEYGIGYGELQWITTEGPHLKEYEDPPFVTRAPAGVSLMELMRSGEIVAIASGPTPGTQPVIPNLAAAQRAWYERHRTMGINHMVSIRSQLANEEPEIVSEFFRMMQEAHRIGTAAMTTDPAALPSAVRLGFEQVRSGVELAGEYATEQRLIPVLPEMDQLFPGFMLES